MKMIMIILEDQPLEIKRLETQLNNWGSKNHFEIELKKYSSGEEYFKLRKDSIESVNVFFLDIQMGKLSGIDVAKKLRQEGYQGAIIFLTAFREYVFHGYAVHALNYLLKPIQQAPLFLCLDEIANSLSGNFYLYRNKQESICIPYHDILCFSSSLHYVNILTLSGDYCQYSTLNNIIEYLPLEFIRTHRSYIVNMAHIYKISGNTITLSNHMTVQIGRSYLKQVSESFVNYVFRFDIIGDNHQ